MKKWVAGAILASILLLALTSGSVYAAGLAEDRIVFGGSAEVAEGEVVDGDLVVFGGSAIVAEDAEITGSVIVFGGSASVAEGAQVGETMVVFGGQATIAGEIAGDLVVFGGGGDLESTGSVGGQVVTIGAAVNQEEGARVAESTSFSDWRPGFNIEGKGPVIVIRNGTLARTARVFTNAAVLAVLALLVVLLLPNQTARIGEALANAPVPSGGIGFLTGVAVPVLITLTAITICLIPFSLAGGLVFAAALLLGWIAIGLKVGNWLVARLHWQNLSPAAAAALGTFLFTIGTGVVALIIPCVGWLVPALAWMVGLGAVTLTRFGSRPYLPPVAPPAPTPPAEMGA